MKHKPFVHLHTHSHYSILDGAIKIPDLIKRANELEFPAVALTDHGNMCGAIEFYKTANSGGIKPIIGIEVYIAPKSRTIKERRGSGKGGPYHLVLLAKNIEGYRNLMKVSSIGYQEGFYYVPRIDKDVLIENSKGLVALSSCIQGEIPRSIIQGDEINAQKSAKEMKDIFGEDFYLEVQYHKMLEEKKAINGILKISKKLSIPIVATNDVHYLTAEDYEAHDILLCLQTQKVVTDKDRMRLKSNSFYLKSYEEMYSIFKDIPESLQNTLEVMDKCNLTLQFDKVRLPNFEIPDNQTSDEYLKKLALDGLKKRYPETYNERIKELEYELNVISSMHLSEYFLIVQDFINFARSRDIMIGPGRGSAAGSILSYALGITNIDPIKNGLFFERFLNPERVTMPDIDVDFEDTRRDEVIEYVKHKYGEDRVSQIITFNTYKAKGVVKGVARALGISPTESNALTKLIEDDSLKESWALSSELQRIINKNEKYKKLWEISLKLEGIISNAGTHAAGVVISNEPLINYTPFFYQPKTNSMVTQYDMDSIKKIGLLKVDFLGLKTLTVIKNCLSQIETNSGIKIDIDKIPFDDKKTFKLLQSGNTFGVFQVESQGMRRLLQNAKPTLFSDISVLIALYRPGPLRSGMAEMFIRRKNKLEKVQYIHPKLKETLEETYGVVVYQEQVMKITQIIGGFSLGQADLIRRAMSSKNAEEMEEQKKLFLEGAKKNGFSAQLAERIFQDIAKFAQYGFNKSHSVAYAVLTYLTAYLKANYTEEFMASALTSEIGKKVEDILQYIREAKKLNIEILPPDINTSELNFVARRVDNKKFIIFGFAAIKNVGTKVSEKIAEERQRNGKYKDLIDFLRRMESGILNRKSMESLIKAGVFDSFKVPRKYLMINLENYMKIADKIKREKNGGVINLFGSETNNYILDDEAKEFSEKDEWDLKEKLKYEKEVLGYYWSAHPLDMYKTLVRKITDIKLDELDKYYDGDSCKLVAVINTVKVRALKKKDDKKGAFLDVVDKRGNIEVKVSPDIFEKYKDIINPDEVIIIEGIFKKSDYTPYSIEAKRILLTEKADKVKHKSVHIKIPYSIAGDEKKLIQVKEILSQNQGNSSVFLHFVSENKKTILKTTPSLFVEPSDKLIEQLSKIIGKDSIYLSK